MKEVLKKIIGEIPLHVAFIMDGNRRWAQEKGLQTYEGHKQGLERVKDLIEHARNTDIKIMTFYCFSTENWKRAKEEVGYLMRLFTDYLKKYFHTLSEKNIRVKHIGRKDRIPKSLLCAITQAEELSKNNTGLLVHLAIDYGGQDEILRAMRKMRESGDICQESFESFLDTAPNNRVDLLIRTSGEKRISNFLLWQTAYSELFFEDRFFPDFSIELFEQIMENYHARKRRFGK